MAINRVIYPTTPTPAAGDWGRIVDLMQTNYMLTEGPARIDWDTDDVLQGAVFQIGGVVYLADAATAITGTPSDYVKITPSDATAAAAYVTDLTGVTWNAVYNGYYDASGNLYVFDEGKALAAGEISSVFGRYLMQQANGDVHAGKDVIISTGSFYQGGAKKVSHFLHESSVTQADIFTALSPYIPLVDDAICVTGGLEIPANTGAIGVIARAVRTTTTEIRFYHMAINHTSGAVYAGNTIITDGSSSSILGISIAW